MGGRDDGHDSQRRGSRRAVWAATIQVYFAWAELPAARQSLVAAILLWSSLPGTGEGGSFRLRGAANIGKFPGMGAVAPTSMPLPSTDKLVLSKLLALREIGYYTVALTPAGLVFYFTVQVVLAFSPRLAQLQASGGTCELARVYHGAAQLVSVLVIPLCSLIVRFPKELLVSLDGESRCRFACPYASPPAGGRHGRQLSYGSTLCSASRRRLDTTRLFSECLFNRAAGATARLVDGQDRRCRGGGGLVTCQYGCVRHISPIDAQETAAR